jgi:hypothetical protein
MGSKDGGVAQLERAPGSDPGDARSSRVAPNKLYDISDKNLRPVGFF